MITQAPFPPDIRLEKEIKSLSSAGYSITVICNQYDKKLNSSFEYCKIERVKAIFESIKINRVINFPIFFNPRYLAKVFGSVVKYKPAFIHAHDLPMVPLALIFGKLFRKRVIFDMHENYPEALKAFQKKGVINFLFKNYRSAKLLEKICVKNVDAVITVVQENTDRIKNLGVNANKIYLVSNTVDLDTFAKEPVDDSIINKYKTHIVLLYAGYVTPERGLDIVVKGIDLLKNRIQNVKLLIIGNGISISRLKKLASERYLVNFIEFIEWPGHNKLSSYFKAAKIFISPQPKCEFWDTTIPHKLFEYMSKAKPVLAADSKAISRIITQTECGLIYKTGDPEDFAAKASEILNANIPFGENGYKAVKDNYNWEQDQKMLIRLYEELAEKDE